MALILDRTHPSGRTPGWWPAPLALAIAACLLVPAAPAAAQCDVTADVVAMDQVITYNRMAAFAPAGMIFALARDVFPKGTLAANQTLGNSCAGSGSCLPGQVQLRDDKRPRPLTLRVNEGCNITITLRNLLNNPDITDAKNEAPGIRLCENPADGVARPGGPGGCQSEQPATRNVSIHVQGLIPVAIADDGSNVGNNGSSLVAPGLSHTYTLTAGKEGAYVITSGPNLGGQGGSGAIASGLFGVLNVEPAGSTWYRSQVTRAEMLLAADKHGTPDLLEADERTLGGQPILDYAAVYPTGHPYEGQPILKILDGNAIFHNELNAIIDGPMPNDKAPYQLYPDRGDPFREFTIAFHDEIKVVQAFPEWYEQLAFTLGSVKDGFAINYGTGGIGSEIIGNRLGVGPMYECAECKYEEFFLTAWAVGDPAMIVDIPANAGLETCDPKLNNCTDVGPKATKAFYPDDPSNVHHSYLNDRTKFRNIHVGTEHHIFHLHAHQWNFINRDEDGDLGKDQSNYLDAQALGPGSSFTYEITYGGAGNRNKTAGDSILHCHFYPHFAQGMWELWRVHDVFEMGSVLGPDGRVVERGLPDAEICVSDDGSGNLVPEAGGTYCGGYDTNGYPIAGGTPVPGVVPIPTKPMAPMPGSYVADTDGDSNPDTPFMGYPFYIPGVAGHRPPTPPMDLVADGGLPRHVITAGTVHAVQTATDFDKVLLTAVGDQLPETGTAAEKAAMAFHGPQAVTPAYHDTWQQNAVGVGGASPATGVFGFEINGLPPVAGAPYAEPCRGDSYDGGVGAPVGNSRFYAASVIELDAELNKVGWHFGQQRILTLDGDVQASLAGIRAPEPFVMRANTRDCIDFNHTNLVPSVYQLDDFQVKSPTDVIGQHIHLVKFDVTSADGSGNGWNYEDGTFSPHEVQERIHALNVGPELGLDGNLLTATPFVGPCPVATANQHHGCAGARTTRQRWYIDPGWSGNVFTHDHFGPSTHQQAGLYGTVLVEPEGSQWLDPTDHTAFGTRADGGPTSWRADIIDGADAYREFYLEFADFQIAYRSAAGDGAGLLNGPNQAINPSYRNEPGLPDVLLPKVVPLANPTTAVIPGCGQGQGSGNPASAAWTGCAPEAISAADPGSFVVNMRNEPLALRVRDPNSNSQAAGLAGDLSYAFQSRTDRADSRLNLPVASWPYGVQTASEGAFAGDPFTPILRAYEGDKVSLRVQVGAHEEGHNFSINGIRWLQNWSSGVSGFRSSQMAGISEYFIFQVPGLGGVTTGPFEDYLYQAGSSTDARWNGSWGILRAYDGDQGLLPDLKTLPTNPDGKVPPNSIGQSGGGVCSEDPTMTCQSNQDCPGGRNRCQPAFQGPCPRGAPERKFDLIAVRGADVLPDLDGDGLGDLVYNNTLGRELWDPTALLYLKTSDLDNQGKLKTDRRVEPLILRAAAGECIFITLTNQFGGAPLDFDGFNTLPMIVNQFNGNQIAPSIEVGLHAQLVEYDMSFSDGMNVGFNPVQSVPPGATYNLGKWYAGRVELTEGTPGNRTAVPVEFGAINLMASDPIEGSSKGLIGALIIEPPGTTWADGEGRGRNRNPDGELDENGQFSRAALTVTCEAAEGCGSLADGESFRDFVVIHQDDVNMWYQEAPLPTVSHEEEPEDSGGKGINYRSDPIWHRLGNPPRADEEFTRQVDYTNAFAGDPQTPIYTATGSEAIRLRILKPGGHNRNSNPTLHGFVWARWPYSNADGYYGGFDDSQWIDPTNDNTFWHGEQMGHGPTNHINVVPLGGCPDTGDWLYRDMVPVHVDNGEWAIVRCQ